MKAKLYTQTRVLQYVGPLEAVLQHMERRAVKGSAPSNWNGGQVRIYEGLIGGAPRDAGVSFVREQVQAHRAEAENFFPDNDDQREGYLNALDWLLDELPL